MSDTAILNSRAAQSKREAKESLVFYFERAGVILSGDNIAEINGIVEDIVSAAVAATTASLIEKGLLR